MTNLANKQSDGREHRDHAALRIQVGLSMHTFYLHLQERGLYVTMSSARTRGSTEEKKH